MEDSAPERGGLGGEITRLTVQKNDSDRMSVFLDGAFAFGVHQDLVLKHQLVTGRRLSPDEHLALIEEDKVMRAKGKAFDYLAHKARTETEVRRKLREKDYASGVIDQVVAYLHDRGYLDDEAYAHEYVRRRFSHKGYGPVRLRMELKKRGIDRHLAETAVDRLFEENDQLPAAQAQAEKKWSRIAREDDPRKRRDKLYRHLKRRGFTYDVIQQVIDEMEDEPLY